MSIESVARKWRDQFVRTDGVDRSKAQAAVGAVYRLAGMEGPQSFLWCASPLEAVWGLLVLVGRTESYNQAVYEDIGRSKPGQEKIARARALVAGRLGIGEADVEGYFGDPFYRATGTNPVSKTLADQSIDTWMARAEAGDDFLSIHAGGPFKPLHDLEQELLHEGYRLRDGAQRPSVIREAMLKEGGRHIEILGGRSAHHRLYGNMAYSEIAMDEALAEAGRLRPTDLQRAMWEAFEACGMWWPCEAGVVFADRPVTAEKLDQSVRLTWSDGFGCQLGG